MTYDPSALLIGALLALIALSCGVILGCYLALKIIHDEVVSSAARLKVDRDEIQRIQLGIEQSWQDRNGDDIKLHTHSALMHMSEKELAKVCSLRGIEWGLGWDQADAVKAIENQQKARFIRRVETIDLPDIDDESIEVRKFPPFKMTGEI